MMAEVERNDVIINDFYKIEQTILRSDFFHLSSYLYKSNFVKIFLAFVATYRYMYVTYIANDGRSRE